MDFLPDIFGSSSEGKDDSLDRTRRSSDLPSGDKSRDSELMAVMKGKNLDMTSSEIKLTTSKTSNHMNVTRSNMLGSIEEAVEEIKSIEGEIFNNVSDREEKKLEMEVHAAEDNSQKVINSDVSHREKLLVSSTVLLEASQLIARYLNDLYGLKTDIGDENRTDKEVRAEMKDLWIEVNKLAEMNMPAYSYIHEHARDEPELVECTVKSANLFRNTVKVFSALTKDTGLAFLKKKEYEGSEADFVPSDNTIFEEHFQDQFTY